MGWTIHDSDLLRAAGFTSIKTIAGDVPLAKILSWTFGRIPEV